MRADAASADEGSVPAFVLRSSDGRQTFEANEVARELLGLARGPAPLPPPHHVLASLTGRSMDAEITEIRSMPGATIVLPILLMGHDCRLIPAMLACRTVEEAVLMEATEIGSSEVLRRGSVDYEVLLRAAVEISPGSIIAIDELGSILTFNAAAEAAFGYSSDEIIGRNITALMTEHDAREYDAHLRRHYHSGERRVIGSMRVVEARRKNGDAFPVELYVDEVRFADRRLYVGFLRDITHRREMQAETTTLQRELIHVTRLASMGEMAAALAHELNQPLAAIAVYAEAARLQLNALDESETSGARDSLAKAAAQAVRAGEVIRRMRQLAMGGAGQRRPENLQTIVREAVALATIGARASGVEATVDEGGPLVTVACDRIQIQQVVINLVRNAIDALDSTTGVHDRTRHPRQVLTRIFGDGDSATVSVSDSGPGIPQAIATRLFDPFLTTKELGVGLGLPISRMIIESHGGKLWLDSSSANGTTFKFTLPLERGERLS